MRHSAISLRDQFQCRFAGREGARMRSGRPPPRRTSPTDACSSGSSTSRLSRMRSRPSRSGCCDSTWSGCVSAGCNRPPCNLETAGIDRAGVTPHKLRDSFACLMVRNGVDLSCLQRMLGHTRLDTTGVYLRASGSPEGRRTGRKGQALSGYPVGGVAGRHVEADNGSARLLSHASGDSVALRVADRDGLRLPRVGHR